MERLQLQKNLGWHFYFCSLSFLILEFGFWCSLCWGGLGFLGQSVYRAAETARWGQSRFHCWSGVSFLRGFREASQWSHSSVVRLLYLWVSLFWYEFFLKFTRVFFLFFSRLPLPFYSDQPDVDFQKVDGHVHQLKGSSSRYRNEIY